MILKKIYKLFEEDDDDDDYVIQSKDQRINLTLLILFQALMKQFNQIWFKNRSMKNKTTKNNFFKLQNMYMYCKNCKKHTGNTFQKKLILI